MGKELATLETVLATVHLNSMGRDEMNLAEFPLATLADRAPRECKTLVFEDRIWDRGQRQHRVRRLTISASDKFGLPTAIDDEVILGLVQVSKTAGFVERRVRFSRYRLIHLLGWRDEGRSYRRLEQSLKRWLGVTLYYENAWWDKAKRRWVDAHFHLLDDVVLYHRPKRGGPVANSDDMALSSFTWNEMVFRSFQAGFLKRLDLEFYRRLKLATTKRMYRFLDKRFHFSNRLRFKLPVFACEHIGLSRRYDTAQFKRRLGPAIDELVQAGYLVPLPVAERYRRLRRGHWEIVFVRAPKTGQRQRQTIPLSDLEERLVARGVTASTAVKLVGQHPADLVAGKLAVFDALRERGDRRISRNPAGFLVKSIRDDYAAPADVSMNTIGARRADGVGGENVVQRRLRCKQAAASVNELERSIDRYLESLSLEERHTLEATALADASGFAAEGLRRSMASGMEAVAGQYRQAIVRQHVQSLLSQPATE